MDAVISRARHDLWLPFPGEEYFDSIIKWNKKDMVLM